MAFDGICVAAITKQLNSELAQGRIQKISQPEKDEILILIKAECGNRRLVLSANPSLPLVYITENNLPSPITAPSFLMVLRKHLSGGRIKNIFQPSLERCIHFDIEHFDEMGDKKTNTLVIELMGKHSNIILVNDEGIIIDAIKRVPSYLSSIREVIPGREYFLPQTIKKSSPLDIKRQDFDNMFREASGNVEKWLVSSFVGISPQIAKEIVFRSNIDDRKTFLDLTDIEKENLKSEFIKIFSNVKDNNFCYCIYEKDKRPFEFSVLKLKQYEDFETNMYDTPSLLVSKYYGDKEVYTRIHQKSTDLRHIVSGALERAKKKYALQLEQEKSTLKKDKYKVYGELLQAYGYSAKKGDKEIKVENYYDNNNEITIPLDTTKTPQENANHYFKRYNKLKRTKEALTTQIKDTKIEIERLESIKASLEIAETEDDLKDIKEELILSHYIRRKGTKNKKEKISKPLHFVTSDDFHIYVGKNNMQNDYLTNTFADKDDMWFHTKSFHGSHVILKSDGREFPDKLYEICASLAAFYSAGREQNKVEVDYTLKKELKKVKGAALGFVIYHTNYSIIVKPEISDLLNLI